MSNDELEEPNKLVNNETLAYVVDRFIHAGVEREKIIALVRTMKEMFAIESENEAEAAVEKYLRTKN
ncbi:hypothetical protein PAECIP111891_03692 [Paenibacillus allorhizoplanae]|uniref:Uncharacterized protein n=1 Tax=Paenibacillus allorhizoplanae TaxID=2905648 RepID=A0ABM9CE52_9BACL|nr:hypothetical protein [Paenibacillus allorhizoplanae]CAH1211110.1 hypothetical protein PAECIP111891_03692 [Paenibacillus allorhizoplanae]